MRLHRFLLLGVALLISAAAFATTTVLAPLNVATEAILPSLAAAALIFAGVSALTWVLVNELVGLARADAPASSWLARFVPPQTGTPEETAFG